MRLQIFGLYGIVSAAAFSQVELSRTLRSTNKFSSNSSYCRPRHQQSFQIASSSSNNVDIDTALQSEVEEVDVAIVGAGIGGLCAAAILNSLYVSTSEDTGRFLK